MFLCASHTDAKHEVLQQLVSEHISDLATLPISAIKQGKSILLPLLGSAANERDDRSAPLPTTFPPPSSDEEDEPASPSQTIHPPPSDGVMHYTVVILLLQRMTSNYTCYHPWVLTLHTTLHGLIDSCLLTPFVLKQDPMVQCCHLLS